MSANRPRWPSGFSYWPHRLEAEVIAMPRAPEITLTKHNGEAALHVLVHIPCRMIFPPCPPDDSFVLDAAVEVCPGANTLETKAASKPHYDPREFYYDHYFALTHANVLALIATNFRWSKGAIEAVASFGITKESVIEAQGKMEAMWEDDWGHIERTELRFRTYQ